MRNDNKLYKFRENDNTKYINSFETKLNNENDKLSDELNSNDKFRLEDEILKNKINELTNYRDSLRLQLEN